MPKRYLTGGGKSLKNREKSYNYFYKTLKPTKYFIEKLIRKAANLYAKLTFGAHDKIGGEGPRAQISLTSERRNQDLSAQISSTSERSNQDLRAPIAASNRSNQAFCGSIAVSDRRNRDFRAQLFIAEEEFELRNSTVFSKYDKIGGESLCAIEDLRHSKNRNEFDNLNTSNDLIGEGIFGVSIAESERNNSAEKSPNLYAKLTFAAYDKIGGKGLCATADYDNLKHRNYQSSFLRRDDDLNQCSFLWNNSVRKLSHFLTPRTEKLLNSRGSVLIEFAVCMPVLIILLFYINDLVRIKRYYSQTEFVAQQMANILQNISQKRSGTGRKITLGDIRHAASLACLSLYPGTSMYKSSTGGYECSFRPRINIFYVKGLSDGKACCPWGRRYLGDSIRTPAEWSPKDPSNNISKVTPSESGVSPSSIYPTLKINNGEEKIIVECNLFTNPTFMDSKAVSDGDNSSTVARKSFGLRLATPNPVTLGESKKEGWFFNSIVIFTPKPGLFDDTPPA